MPDEASSPFRRLAILHAVRYNGRLAYGTFGSAAACGIRGLLRGYNAVAVQTDGKIVAAVLTETVSSRTRILLKAARYNADGSRYIISGTGHTEIGFNMMTVMRRRSLSTAPQNYRCGLCHFQFQRGFCRRPPKLQRLAGHNL